jgi:DNA-binding MarR family transcriptional regulator
MEPGSTPESLVLSLRRSTRVLQQLLTARARESGLSLPELFTLIRAAEGDGVVVSDARDALGLGSSSMTDLADRLERDGLLRRVPHPTDRRSTVLRATRRGEGVRARALDPLLGGLARIVAELDRDELGVIERFMDSTSELYSEMAASHAPRQAGARRSSAPRRPRRQGA